MRVPTMNVVMLTEASACDATDIEEALSLGPKKKDQLRIADPINNQLMVFLNYVTPVVQVFLLTCAYPL
jgi:hypothetical protein